MGLARNIMRAGFSAGQAKAINGEVATGLTAAGTVITDALDLTADLNVIGTAAANTGVQLPSCEIGDSCQVYNGGANSVKVYPDSSANNINQLSAGAAMLLGTNTTCQYSKVSATRWIATLSA
jgi:hypothetical protein